MAGLGMELTYTTWKLQFVVFFLLPELVPFVLMVCGDEEVQSLNLAVPIPV